MRLGIALMLLALFAVPAGPVRAHLADEFPQVMLQITIDDDAVELVVTIPAKTATLDVFDGLSPAEMDQMEPLALARLIAPILAKRCPVMIDGIVVAPTILGPAVDMDHSDQRTRRSPVAQGLDKGGLTFLARYETKAPPSQVSLNWSIFANQYDDVDQPIHAEELLMVAALLAAEQQEQFVFLTPIEPGYTWHATSRKVWPTKSWESTPVERDDIDIPLPSIGLVLAGMVCGGVILRQSKPRGIGAMTFCLVAAGVCLPYGHVTIKRTPAAMALNEADSLALFASLHRNIYRAFDYTDEGTVYDALAQSVDGPMLDTIYNDVYQSLIMREENGAVSKVVRVEIDQVFLESMSEQRKDQFGSAAYAVYCAWQVDGLVTHFEHTHARTNAFEAIYTIAPRANGWRIVDSQILQQQRIDDGNKTAQDLLNPTPNQAKQDEQDEQP